MVTVENIEAYMNSLCPGHLAFDGDNVGLITGRKDKCVKKVLITLDVDEFVADEAIKNNISTKVKAKDIIDILWEDNIPENIEPQDIPLRILYEDQNVTIVNKPQGMVTHPAAGNWQGTLVNALLFHWGMEAVPQVKDGSDNEKGGCNLTTGHRSRK